MAFTRVAALLHAALSDVVGGQHHQDLPALTTSPNDILRASGAGVMERAGAVSQAEAEAGVSGAIRGFSALRVAQAIAAQAARIATGSYTGDGSTSQAITGIGFQPKWLHITEQNTTDDTTTGNESIMYTSDVIIDDLAAGGALRDVAASSPTMGDNTVIALGVDGFTVDDEAGDNHPNQNLVVYNFLALG